MSRNRKDVADLQRHVWGRLPMRKYLYGHDKVFDTVAVILQEWPVDAIDRSSSGDTDEVHALEDLAASCKRHLALAYGESEWSMWDSAMKYLIWQTIWVMLHWYRQDAVHRSALIRMRSRWRYKN